MKSRKFKKRIATINRRRDKVYRHCGVRLAYYNYPAVFEKALRGIGEWFSDSAKALSAWVNQEIEDKRAHVERDRNNPTN